MSKNFIDFDSSFGKLVIKIGSLLSFCGGPMLFLDQLKKSIDERVAFAICFFPIAIMILAVFVLQENDRPNWAKLLLVKSAAVSILLLLVVDCYAIYQLRMGPALPDEGLYAFGSFVGFVVVGLYSWMLKNWFKKQLTPKS